MQDWTQWTAIELSQKVMMINAEASLSFPQAVPDRCFCKQKIINSPPKNINSLYHKIIYFYKQHLYFKT